MSAPVSIGCQALDSLLGGGLDRGTVTQLYGAPASGKTNVALSTVVQTAADGNIAVFIDTEGLSIDRFSQFVDGVDGGDVSSNVVFSEAHNFEEQADAVRDVSEVAPDADLIVLDSATGFYRLERTENENGEALRSVARQVTTLLGLARRHDLAVLITNQVYTDPDSEQISPLGGYTLAHWTGVIVRLDRFRGGNRRATLEKHHSRPTGDSVRFQITETGLRSGEEPGPDSV